MLVFTLHVVMFPVRRDPYRMLRNSIDLEDPASSSGGGNIFGFALHMK